MSLAELLRGAILRFLGWFPRHAGWVLAACLVLTLAAAFTVVDPRSGRSRLQVDPSAERLLPDADESRLFFERVREIFGSDETLVIGYASDDIFATSSLERIAAMTARIQKLRGVDRVLSLTNARNVRGEEWGIEIAPFVTEVPQDAAGLASLREEVEANPLFAGSLVASDGRATAVLVYFLPMSSQEFIEAGLDGDITRVAQEEKGDGEVWITGGPHIRAETARILFGETFSLSALVLLVLGSVLAFSFRTIRGVALPLLTILVAVTWTMAFIALTGVPLNAVTALVPPLLTTLGLSYSVHVVSEYYEAARGSPGAPASLITAHATSNVVIPVGLTGLTTAVGFLSLGLSPLAAVREFGFFAVIGVLCTVVASLTFTPAVLSLLPVPARLSREAGGRGGFGFEKFAERIAHFDLAHRREIWVAFFAVFLLSLYGASMIQVGTQQISKFRPDAPVRLHFEAVNERLGGANPLYVILESDSPDAFKEPANLASLEQLQAWLEEQPEIGGTTSLVDYVKLINRGFHENDPDQLVVPATRRLVSQLLLFGGGEELERYVDTRYQMASVHVRARVIDSDEVAALVERIEARLAELPGHLEGTVTGTAVVFTQALDDIMRGQAQSVLLALLVIYGILSAMFVSLRIGLLALIPNALPVVAYFGALGFTGILLSPGTSLIAPMVLGIAVDDTIHYFARFIRDTRRTANEERATVSALKAVGRPVTYTSLALVLGFLVLLLSEITSQGQLGMMAALSLAFAWATDLFLTPSLCARLRIATLWDFLSVDLGTEPHKSITLLKGLRASQARIVALLSEFVSVRSGERLFDEGEPGDAIYAVIDGELLASFEREGERIEIGRYGHGDVVGEVGLFRMARSADVVALTDARLLRLTEQSLEQLNRRSPRVSSAVYRNLSGVVADRLVARTELLSRRAGGTESAPPVLPGRTASRPELLATSSRVLVEAFFGDGGAGVAAGDGRVAVGGKGAGGYGVVDPQVVAVLSRLGVSFDALTALVVVPLVEVAWADDTISPGERSAVMEAAGALGLAPGSPGLELLGAWLERRPPDTLLGAWRRVVGTICAELSLEARHRLRDGIVSSARGVAEAAGGFLGVGTVSRREEALLAEFEEAFGPPASS